MELLPVLTLIRLVVPLVILRYQLLGISLAILVDIYDYLFLSIHTSQEYKFYQSWDKSMDLYMFSYAFAMSLKWKDKTARLLSILSFGIRAVGDTIFLLTGFQAILLLTPNVFESLLLFYLLYTKLSGTQKLYTTKEKTVLILVVLLVPKLCHEYLLHVLKHQPWELYSFGSVLGTTGLLKDYIDYLGWGAIIYAFPIALMGYLLATKSKKITH